MEGTEVTPVTVVTLGAAILLDYQAFISEMKSRMTATRLLRVDSFYSKAQVFKRLKWTISLLAGRS
jgi:hypothetical protein